jgi:cobaltochelatase CobN
MTTGRRAGRNIVIRADGRLVNVNRQLGQLFVCAHGCCCGRVDEGKPATNYALYHEEWERRKLRNRVHLNMGGCLGPCPLANVCMLLFDGRTVFFHSMNEDRLILALFDYIERLVQVGTFFPPDDELGRLAFSAMRNDGQGSQAIQTTADVAETGQFVVLAHSDTDILLFEQARHLLDPRAPELVTRNITGLRREQDAVALFRTLVPAAAVVLLVVHGGTKSVPGFDELVQLCEEYGTWLIAVPGTEELDPELIGASTSGAAIALHVRAYLQQGGAENYRELIHFVCDHLLAAGLGYRDPLPQPRVGVYRKGGGTMTLDEWKAGRNPDRPAVGVLFYRSLLLAGDTRWLDRLIEAGERLGSDVLPVFGYSLKDDPDERGRTAVLRLLCDERGAPLVDVVVNTMSFALGSAGEALSGEEWNVRVLEELGIPQVQGIPVSISAEAWEASALGVPPQDVAMSVAIPELDGRIIGVPCSFKESVEVGGRRLPVRDVPVDRAERLMGLAMRLARLRRLPNNAKRVAIILTNHHAKASRIANAVGLDAAASTVALLQRLAKEGYQVGDVPESGEALLQMLLGSGHYDADFLTEETMAGAAARIPADRYRSWFSELPPERQAEMRAQWGDPPGDRYVDRDGNIVLAGLVFGNVFVAVQPPRGYSMDAAAIAHTPNLPPPHVYYALYRWLREPVESGGFGADAIVQVGKHGSAEWLPGKGVGVSATCYPDLFVGDLPIVYPFIIDGPGEGAAAKRRTHAVIVDHLPPPISNAELYGELATLERLVDEYYLLERTDPEKLPYLQRQIWQVLKQANLAGEIDRFLAAGSGDGHVHEWDPREHEDGVPYSISDLTGEEFAHLVEAIHAYTHELSALPIRVGLHVLGQPPTGEKLVSMLSALVRLPNGDIPSLPDAVLAAYGGEGETAEGWRDRLSADAALPVSDATAAERAAARLADRLLEATVAGLPAHDAIAQVCPASNPDGRDRIRRVLEFVSGWLIPALRRATDEIDHIVDALAGRYVPSGPSGALTRGMAHALPTGRNFYAVDPRAIPTPTAWEVGVELAEAVLERYRRETGGTPTTVGISMWGTTAMRNGGEDVAEALWLLGVRPRWQRENRRVVGCEVVPYEELGRPRVDVVVRVSGFFRDAFPGAIALLDEAVDLVSSLDEPAELNPIRQHRLERAEELKKAGVAPEEAWERAGLRVFSSEPGVYGAGILQLLDERAWDRLEAVVDTFVNWGGYAYSRWHHGTDAREDFRALLGRIDVAVQNQDNREHDILDADDYFQFQGGMVAASRVLGRAPARAYHGDSSDPRRPRVRSVKEELDRVFRARVLNPKWLASMREHGYRGAVEFAATADYLFGWAVTAGVVDDWQFAAFAERYVLDGEMRDFLTRTNPWALRDMALRLLEAAERGVWSQPPPGMVAKLEAALADAEGAIEAEA